MQPWLALRECGPCLGPVRAFLVRHGRAVGKHLEYMAQHRVVHKLKRPRLPVCVVEHKVHAGSPFHWDTSGSRRIRLAISSARSPTNCSSLGVSIPMRKVTPVEVAAKIASSLSTRLTFPNSLLGG